MLRRQPYSAISYEATVRTMTHLVYSTSTYSERSCPRRELDASLSLATKPLSHRSVTDATSLRYSDKNLRNDFMKWKHIPKQRNTPRKEENLQIKKIETSQPIIKQKKKRISFGCSGCPSDGQKDDPAHLLGPNPIARNRRHAADGCRQPYCQSKPPFEPRNGLKGVQRMKLFSEMYIFGGGGSLVVCRVSWVGEPCDSDLSNLNLLNHYTSSPTVVLCTFYIFVVW